MTALLAGAPDAATQCRIMIDLAAQLKADNYDPMVGKTDCHDAFAAAGMPMHDLSRVVNFEPAQGAGANTVTVRINYRCLARCGSGEEVTAQRRAGRWTIIKRHMTWIS
jgi:hypothetical protein